MWLMSSMHVCEFAVWLRNSSFIYGAWRQIFVVLKMKHTVLSFSHLELNTGKVCKDWFVTDVNAVTKALINYPRFQNAPSLIYRLPLSLKGRAIVKNRLYSNANECGDILKSSAISRFLTTVSQHYHRPCVLGSDINIQGTLYKCWEWRNLISRNYELRRWGNSLWLP